MVTMAELKKLTTQEEPPTLIPTPDTWAFCQEIGEEKGRSPKKILSQFTAIGEIVVKLNKRNVKVIAIGPRGDEEISLDIFKD